MKINKLAIFLSVYLSAITLLSAQNLPTGFVYADQVIPDLVFEPRYYSNDNFTGRRVDGYLSPECIMTAKCAIALKSVQSELNDKGMGLKIFDAYRPQMAVNCFIRWVYNINDQKNKAIYYPDVDKRNLFRDGYIASLSGHSRGSTVDLTILEFGEDEKYAELDMGTCFDFFGPKAWPFSMDITEKQHDNRMLLRNIMEKHGFVPYDKEWWHFTLKEEPFPDTYFNFPIMNKRKSEK